MKRKEVFGNPMYYIVDKETAEKAVQAIKEGEHSIFTDFELEIGKLRQKAEMVSANQLSDGKRYGKIDLSVNEILENGRFGTNVHIYVWSFCKEKNVFFCKSAWGGVTERRFPDAAVLVEL